MTGHLGPHSITSLFWCDNGGNQQRSNWAPRAATIPPAEAPKLQISSDRSAPGRLRLSREEILGLTSAPFQVSGLCWGEQKVGKGQGGLLGRRGWAVSGGGGTVRLMEGLSGKPRSRVGALRKEGKGKGGHTHTCLQSGPEHAGVPGGTPWSHTCLCTQEGL